MLTLSLTACLGTSPVEPPAEPLALPRPAVDGVVWTAIVTVAPRTLPGRFSAPVASVLAAGDPEALPLATFADQLCTDRAGAREALLAALVAGSTDEGWWYASADVDCRDPGLCAFVERSLPLVPEASRGPLWALAEDCATPSSDERILASGPDASALTVALRLQGWHPRLGRMAAELDDPAWLQALGDVLPRFAGPEAEQARATVEARLRPEPLRTAPVELQHLDEAFLAGFPPASAMTRFPNHREVVAGALERAIGRADQDPILARSAARALVSLDRDRARSVLGATADPWSVLKDVLVDDPAVVRASFVELGFPARGEPAPGPEPTTVGELLASLGHAVVLDGYPVLGDAALAYRLAALAGLRGVEFEVLAPEGLPHGDRTPRPALFAWTGGERVRTLLDPDGYDTVHVVAFVNALLARADREERLALDATRTAVLVGKPDRLFALPLDFAALDAVAVEDP